MTFVKLIARDGWLYPVNEKGETDWVCPKCGHQHTSCCGNSHFPCKEGPNYGGKCECHYLDDMMPSFDFTIYAQKQARKIDVVPYKTEVYDFIIRIGNVQSIGSVTAGGAMAISVTKEELETLLKKGQETLSSFYGDKTHE
jgi:hypothetical protein